MKASLKVALGVAIVLVITVVTLVSVLDVQWNSGGVKVIAANESGIKAWGEYISTSYDKNTDSIGSIVLVGNVNDNPKLRSLWNLTDLPASYSFSPHVILVRNVTFVTGTASNIYLTANELGIEFHPARLATFIAVFLALVIVFTVAMEDSSTRAFYVIIAFLIGVWSLNTSPSFTKPALKLFYSLLIKSSSLGLSPGWISLENMFYAHVVLMLLTVTMIFYTAPRRFRELGFVISGLLMAVPMVRDQISTISPLSLAFFIFATTIAMVSNFTFPENRRKSILQTVTLSIFTSVSILLQPLTAILPIAFVLTFPRRKRNILYLSMTAVGVVTGFVLGHAEWHAIWSALREESVEVSWNSALLQLALPLTLASYLLLKGRVIMRSKGITPFTTILTLVLGFASMLNPAIIPYFFLSLMIMVMRLMIGVEERGTKTLSPL